MTGLLACKPELEAAMLAEACLRAIEAEDPKAASKYYRARYYDPKLGRFISEDPIGFAADVNFYSYVGNKPITWKDPMGLEDFPTTGTLPGTNIPYRMDMRQQPAPNMHVYWEGTKNGPQTVISSQGGWLASHGNKNVVRPPITYRPALRQVAKSFCARAARAGARAAGPLGLALELIYGGVPLDAADVVPPGMEPAFPVTKAPPPFDPLFE